MDAKRMVTETTEALRLAQEALKIVMDRRSTDEAARRLMDLFRTMDRRELQCVAVVLAAATMVTIELSSKIIVDIFAEHATDEPTPDWVVPAIAKDLNRFVTEGLNPDNPKTSAMMREFFTKAEQQRKNQEEA